MNVVTFLIIYISGGITLPPFILGCIFLHALFACPTRHDPEQEEVAGHNTGISTLLENGKDQERVSPARAPGADVAAGYFAVSRQFVPGGLSGRANERSQSTASGTTVESSSIYQNMYRSVFERGKVQHPGIDIDRGNGKQLGKARHVFYVVLRHGHLMLYDNSEELEVRHVIFLAHYDVDLFAGDDQLSEGDLFVKRNCIRLKRKSANDDELVPSTRPYFMFCDNASEKEDFYHALLHNLDAAEENSVPLLLPIGFESSHLVKLIQKIHESEENLQTRWFNAILGRLFFALYKTEDVEDYLRSKISRKISRVNKPTFIDSIHLRAIHLGDAAPIFTNQKLRELKLDGDLTVDADVKYNGGFRLEIAATARIELGQRFKAREVSLILVGTLKELDGHVLVRIKPPPTNRLWIAFETMPQMTLSIEPIVSSRQITYGIILRAIENRIREVVKDTLVLPNWDDIPFSNSSKQCFRGGIWATNNNRPLTNVEKGFGDGKLAKLAKCTTDGSQAQTTTLDEAIRSPGKTIEGCHEAYELLGGSGEADPALDDLSDRDAHAKAPTNISKPADTLQSSPSVVTFAPPTTVDETTASQTSSLKMISSHEDGQSIAETSAELLETRSLPASQPNSASLLDQVGNEHETCNTYACSGDKMTFSHTSSASSLDRNLPTRRKSRRDRVTKQPTEHIMTVPDSTLHSTPSSRSSGYNDVPHYGLAPTTDDGTKKWGWNILSRRQSSPKNVTQSSPAAELKKGPIQPMGRGQPLPPAGMPLPGPQKQSWSMPYL
ncbi:MAG: hypothetical protein Q9165_008848 [Trypethelium subeluteriae]